MIVIVSFLVFRMLSIYYKLRKMDSEKFHCLAKTAGTISEAQNWILTVYFSISTIGIWVNYLMFHDDYFKFSDSLIAGFYMGFNTVKLIFELTIGMVFIALFITFNKETALYQ